MYSVPEATEDVVDAFSQSFSPFRLPQRLGDRKPSTDSDLGSKESLTTPTEEEGSGSRAGWGVAQHQPESTSRLQARRVAAHERATRAQSTVGLREHHTELPLA